MSELALKLIREAKEKRLTRLDLGNCGLTELPDELFELTWLEELILSNEGFIFDFDNNLVSNFESQNQGPPNHIMKISSKIKQLKGLKTLLVNGKMTNDKWILKNINALKGLLNLQQLWLQNTFVSDLKPLKALNNLERLYVFRTEVQNLEPLRGLVNLQKLDISHSRVEDLSPLKEHFNNSKFNVNFKNCPLTTPPIEIGEQGNYAISRYFKNINQPFTIEMIDGKRIKINQQDIITIDTILDIIENSTGSSQEFITIKNIDGSEFKLFFNNIVRIIKNEKPQSDEVNLTNQNSDNELLKNLSKELSTKYIVEAFIEEYKTLNSTVELYEAKLIIVGEGETGKTTLFKKLINPQYILEPLKETHGINIHEGLEFNHHLVGENIFNANLWDFGGQELQYMTHQFFLTPRALYVLMMDARRESPNLAYWFKIISLLGRDNVDSTEKVRLLLVFNKRGNTTGTPPQYQDQLKYYADSLDVQYLEVDFAENDYRFDNLQKAIQQSLVTLPIVKSQLPRLWKVVREDLREEAKKECYITTKRFSDICSKHGITEEADQWLLSGYLHQLGSLLHFQNDKGLRRLVILSPQWAVDGVYTFLSEESIARNNGRFTEDEFMALLARRGYNRADADVILQLMTKNNFDICYEATEGHYVAAQLLPDNAPLSIKWFPRDVLQFRYQYPIMPKGLMSRLIVRLSDDIERDVDSGEQIVWKKGVVLHIKGKEGQCRVRLREDDAESKAGLRQILIDVMGDRDARKYALRKVRDTVDDLHKRWFRSIKADEMVPCCCSECGISETPELHKLEKLIKLRSKDKNLPIRCYESGEEVSTQDLLEGVYDKNEIVEKDNFGKY
jgi:internalin A